MRALVRYVSTVDTHAESALKVIAYFDALVEHRATLEACVRAAAGLRQCTAGLRDDASSWSLRFDHRGGAVDGVGTPTTARMVRLGDRSVGEVWLERDDVARPLDELVVERMALATAILWHASTRPSRSTASLMELVLASHSTLEERGRGLKLLGLDPQLPLSLAAVATDDGDNLAEAVSAVRDAIQDGGTVTERQAVCSSVLGNIGAVLTQPGIDTRRETNWTLPKLQSVNGARVGISHRLMPQQLSAAWPQVQIATRFCGLLGFPNVVDYAELGSLATLALLPQASIDSNPDVQALMRLAVTDRGLSTLDTLQKCLSSGSLRAAGSELHLHHSSVSHRLRQAEKTLGLDLKNPQGRLRTEIALILWRTSTR